MPEALFARRDYLKLAATVSVSGWLGNLARAAATDPARKRSCIVLWLNGGPATIDLWDVKTGHANGGPTKAISAAPGLQISENLPKLAKHGKNLAVIRSMSTKEGDHGRATYLLRTGTLPQGAIDFPTLGSLMAKELAAGPTDLPPFVSVAPQRFLAQNAFGAGFLGPQFAPLVVADGQSDGQGTNVDAALKVQDLDRPAGVNPAGAADRLALMRDLEAGFTAARPGLTGASHKSAYEAAVRLMNPDTAKAFTLAEEKPATRDKYGRNLFGQGCLLARRLVERNVPFVEVTLNGWDTHQNNFDEVKKLCGTLDAAWAALMDDLADRGLLESTTIVCMGEFGRTPKINQQKGRDHWADSWAVALAGGGVRGGIAFGKTSKDGMKVEDKPTTVPDLLATVCKAVGVDFEKQNMSNVGRPIRIVDKAAVPVAEVLS